MQKRIKQFPVEWVYHGALCLDDKKEIPTMYSFGNAWVLVVFLDLPLDLFFSFMMPVRRTAYRQMQSPLQLLQRRYAAGETTK